MRRESLSKTPPIKLEIPCVKECPLRAAVVDEILARGHAGKAEPAPRPVSHAAKKALKRRRLAEEAWERGE